MVFSESVEKLRISEIFTSLQGETTAAGFPFLFIRLAGCPLACSWCDTPHAQPMDSGEFISLEEILTHVDASPFSRVLVTGGEPLAQSGTVSLLENILSRGKIVSLETGGAYSLERISAAVRLILDWKPPSARSTMPFILDNLDFLKADDEMKIVVDDQSDFDFALQCDKKHDLSKRCLFSISPTPRYLAASKDFPGQILASGRDIRINYQLHKHFFSDPSLMPCNPE